MRPAPGRLAALLLVVLCSACASSRSATDRPRVDRDLITQEEMLEHRFTNVYDAVAALRSNWLRPRGPDSFVSPSQVWVYFDNTRMGGVESLRLIQPSVVAAARFYDGLDAQGRWGVGHAAGVIHVTSFPGANAPPGRGGGALPDSVSYVSPEPGAGRFALYGGGRAAPVHVSARDLPGVLRAAGDLRADIGRVTGVEPRLVVDSMPAGREVVLVGTLGRSPPIDRLVREGKVDTAGVSGRWETFLVQSVPNPAPGVERALVVAGSDRRGTIFGIYDLSAEIGVSPWYWWADVPTQRREALYVLPGRHTKGTPAVRYRGIFINDEAPALSGWARERFGGFNHQFYEKVFELVLRLKGNYLWPAMWGSAFAVDDTLNARLADEYGIVMGTSHHEPLTRAHAEWARFGRGPWNYEQNDSTLRAFCS
jgi:hypothetical protein